VWNLKLTIGNLVMSMIEENTAESLLVAKVTGNQSNHIDLHTRAGSALLSITA